MTTTNNTPSNIPPSNVPPANVPPSNISPSNIPTSTNQNSISFIKSNKGKSLLLLNQYLFKCNKSTDSKRYWICTESGCGVAVQTKLNNDFLSITADHNHMADQDALQRRLLKEKMKDRILTETTSLTKIYDEEISKAGLSQAEAAQFPTVVEYRSNMSKTRRKTTPVIPTSCVFDIPESYQKTLSQQRFLLMDFFLKRGKERVIVYSTEIQLQLLFDSKTIFIDGTFGGAPAGFEQLFLIHVQHLGQGLPVAFCLMSNRKAITYAELFQRLKQQAIEMGKSYEPSRIVSDFESALVPVVRQEFPNAAHSGCSFHFIQSIHRKIMALGLGVPYAQDAVIREQCKHLMALSLMPVSKVEEQFKRIRAIASTALDDLFTYFDRQWINGNIPLLMWNCHDLDHRTNNISEAYNRRFGTRVMRKHPNIWTFIQIIQNENARIEHLIIQLGAGALPAKKTTQTTTFQRRFETLKARFDNNEINARKLLDALALLIGGHKK